jgi:putative ABC transport system ATP-binding protein
MINDPQPPDNDEQSVPDGSLPTIHSPSSPMINEQVGRPKRTVLKPEVPSTHTISDELTSPDMAVVAAGEKTVKATSTSVITVRDLKKTYLLGQNRVQALRGVSLEVHAGEFLAVMGPSGSGKSTFMNLLGCLDRPTQGEYWLVGRRVSHQSNDELADIRNRLIGFVFQGFNLLNRASALKNVALPLIYAGYSKEEQERRARKVLKLVGLGSRMNHKPSQLSGGQQQRVAIARALVNGPSLLLADEPTGNLDSRTSLEIMAILQALNKQGLTIVLVTHEPDIATYSKRQVTFRDGRILRDEPVLAPRSAQEEWTALLDTHTDLSKVHIAEDS